MKAKVAEGDLNFGGCLWEMLTLFAMAMILGLPFGAALKIGAFCEQAGMQPAFILLEKPVYWPQWMLTAFGISVAVSIFAVKLRNSKKEAEG